MANDFSVLKNMLATALDDHPKLPESVFDRAIRIFKHNEDVTLLHLPLKDQINVLDELIKDGRASKAGGMYRLKRKNIFSRRQARPEPPKSPMCPMVRS